MQKQLKGVLELDPDVLAHKLDISKATARRIQNRIATAPALLDVCYEVINLITGNPDGDDTRTPEKVSDLAFEAISEADPEFKIITY